MQFRKAPKVLQIQINNADVYTHIVPSNVTSSASKPIEEERARQYLNIDLMTYNNMVGGRMWSEFVNDDLKNGHIICKADVIAYYRILSRAESVSSYLSTKPKKK